MTLTRAIEGAKDGSVVEMDFHTAYGKTPILAIHEKHFHVTPSELAALRAKYPKKFKEM